MALQNGNVTLDINLILLKLGVMLVLPVLFNQHLVLPSVNLVLPELIQMSLVLSGVLLVVQPIAVQVLVLEIRRKQHVQ